MHQQQEAKNSNYQQRLDIVSKPDVWRPRFGDEERILTNDQLKQQFTLPMLMFHYIKDIPATSPDQLGYKLSYSPQKLEELLQFLKAHDIETLTFWDLKAIAEGRKPQPPKSVILTFDDGHREHFNLVMPLLKKYGATAVFFVITDFADKDPLFVTREEIRQMMEAGFEI